MLLGQAVQLAAQKADWKVGIQTWTFHNLTLMETLDKTQQLGMGYAEAFFFQELGAPFPKETYLNYDLSMMTALYYAMSSRKGESSRSPLV